MKALLWNAVILSVLTLSVACGQSLDTSVDLTEGWEGHAWGTDQQTLVKALSLERGDRTVDGPRTIIKSAQVRKLNGAKVGVSYVFANEKFAGVYLRSRLSTGIDDARAGLTAWFGPAVRADLWRKDRVKAHLSRKGEQFFVVILHEDHVR